MIVTITKAVPASVEKASQQLFQSTMLEGLHVVTDPFVSQLKDKDPYPSIGPQYFQQDLIVNRGVQVGFGNKSSIWVFREKDTKPHFPPWAPKSGLSFPGAKTISLRGTKGNHLFETQWGDFKPKIQQALQSASYAYVIKCIGSAE